jgi:hypothetical protein
MVRRIKRGPLLYQQRSAHHVTGVTENPEK